MQVQLRCGPTVRLAPSAARPYNLADPAQESDYSRLAPADESTANMRIIAGKWRSRKLVRPDTGSTRPVPDRVKEAIFNILGHCYGMPGELPPIHAADVFAGSGSLGLEALSRGALGCVFFEQDGTALAALRRNMRALAAESEAMVITENAWRLAHLRPDGRPFDLIFLDPPYRDSADATAAGLVCRFFARIAERTDNRPLVVLHHSTPAAYELDPAQGWAVADQRRIGSNSITFFAR